MIILKVSSNHTFCSSVIFPEAILQAWCLHTEAKCPLGRFCGWISFWAQIWGSVDKLLWAANVNYLKLCCSPFPINLCKTQEGIFFLSWKQNFPMLILLLKSRPMRGHLSSCSWGRVMEVTILLSFLSIFHISQSIFFFFPSLALPGKELDWKLWLGSRCLVHKLHQAHGLDEALGGTCSLETKASCDWLANLHQPSRMGCSNYISCLFGKNASTRVEITGSMIARARPH